MDKKGSKEDINVLKIRHLRNQCEVLKEEYERKLNEYLEIADKISKVNDNLNQEIAERKLIETKLIQSQNQLRALTEYLHQVQEKERTIIARDIHDELGQALTALRMDVAWLERAIPKELRLLRRKTKSMSKLIGKTLKTTKSLISELRPTVLDDFGLEAAIEWYVKEFKTRTDIDMEIHIDLRETALDQNCSTTIFRIFQETLTNVARHAHATKVIVTIVEDTDSLVIKIDDNGIGITEKQITDANSFGLIGMRERLLLLDGKLEISGMKNDGTKVIATIPLERMRASP